MPGAFPKKLPIVYDSDRKNELTRLAKRLKQSFKDLSLLDCALTHSSFVNESGGNVQDNERLEYLGDSVLGLIVNEYLFHKYPTYAEGELARIKSFLVSESSLAAVAVACQIGPALLLGRGEKNSGGAERPSNLANALEALIAAVYLDRGLKQARKFVLDILAEQMEKALIESRDPKSRLQEYVQKTMRQTPSYELLQESGPDHSKEFTCGVIIDGRELARGQGSSRKSAERSAAEKALTVLQREEMS